MNFLVKLKKKDKTTGQKVHAPKKTYQLRSSKVKLKEFKEISVQAIKTDIIK